MRKGVPQDLRMIVRRHPKLPQMPAHLHGSRVDNVTRFRQLAKDHDQEHRGIVDYVRAMSAWHIWLWICVS